MSARLTLFPTALPARVIYLQEGESYVVGRHSECQILVEDPRISRRHARIEAGAEGWWIHDLGSRNGTTLDGESLQQGRSLDSSPWLAFGGFPGRFEVLSDDEAAVARERESDLQRVSNQMEDRLATSPSLHSLLQRSLEFVQRLGGADRGWALLKAGEELQVHAQVGVEGPVPRDFEGSRSLVREVLREGRPRVSSDALKDHRLGGRTSVIQGAIRSVVCVPLRLADRNLGVLYADSERRGKVFTELDVSLLENVAHHTALAIQVAQLEQELEGISQTLPRTTARAKG